jgi:hypothetical protein
LNGEPVLFAALPGSTGAEKPQLNPADVPGWPVVGVWIAPAMPAGTSVAKAVTAPIARMPRILDMEMLLPFG